MKNPLVFVDKFLNSVTMYALLIMGLFLISFSAFILSFFGLISLEPIPLLISLVTLVLVSMLSSTVFSKIWNVPSNKESAVITAFILFLIVSPANTAFDLYVLLGIAVVAQLSKYVLGFKGKHFFNPVAISAVLLGLFGIGNIVWWVGSIYLLPVVAVVGFLIVRKIRRFNLFVSFFAGSVLSLFLVQIYQGSVSQFGEVLWQNITSWPLIFFGTIMLTEPITMPPTKRKQMAYGFIVGLMFSIPFHIGPLYGTPELALIIGNIFSYCVSFKTRLRLVLKERVEIAQGIFKFVFNTSRIPSFSAGQYFEMTLSDSKPDNRGNRRYFTIASSPTEHEVQIGIKILPQGSTFKQRLHALPLGGVVYAGQISGDFVLPKDVHKKLVFIAGGIGITPFRSMVKYMLDTSSTHKSVLFYAVKDSKELAYIDIFTEAVQKNMLTYVPVLNPKIEGWQGESGYINKDMVVRHVGDFKDCLYYISGPSAMVDSYKKLLLSMGVAKKSIKTDYFPGL